MADITSATRRDGTVISMEGKVVTDFPGCEGRVFIVCKITPHPTCESGFMVLVHLEHDAQRTLDGHRGIGLDTNWFKNADQPADQERSGLHTNPGTGDDDDAGRAVVDPHSDTPLRRDGQRGGGRGMGGRTDQQLGLEL
jgi:hypothetical protein